MITRERANELWEKERAERIEKRPEEVTGLLENWYYESVFHIIWGDIYHDIRKRFFDGQHIHTSHLDMSKEEVRSLKKGDIVHTLNSHYELGEPQKIE